MSKLIPKNKYDFETLENIEHASRDEIEPYLEELFSWTEDLNWPIAAKLAKILTKFGTAIIPYIQDILDKPDGLRELVFWENMLQVLTKEQLVAIQTDLEQVANNPTAIELDMGYNIIALKYII